MSTPRDRLWLSTVPATASAGDTHRREIDAPVGTGIDGQVPNSMPRAEDDAITGAGNRDVHDRPGSGHDTARRRTYF